MYDLKCSNMLNLLYTDCQLLTYYTYSYAIEYPLSEEVKNKRTKKKSNKFYVRDVILYMNQNG